MFIASPSDQIALNADGPRFRMPVCGPESDFVNHFVQQRLPAAQAGLIRSVFIEPKVAGAFPDVVVAYWDPRVAAYWSSERLKLTKRELVILHGAYCLGRIDQDQMVRQYGKTGWRISLERLTAAGTVKQRGSRLLLPKLRDVFALRRLIAIEAKLSDYKRGLMQAIQNTWFASDSYLLAPGRPRDPAMLALAQRTGVGLLGPHDFLDTSPVQPRRDRIPRSYFSWLFNEWTWRLERDAITKLPVPTRLAGFAIP